MRCVHHASVADVQADVSEPGEDEHIARLLPALWDAPTLAIEAVGGARDFNAESPVRPEHEPGAVEPARRRGASPLIRNANRSERDSGRTFAERSRRSVRRSPLGPEPVRQRRRLRFLVRLGGRARDEARGKGERKQSSAVWVRHLERE